MQLSNIPGKLVLPFANAGGKSTIPVASQIGITAGAASLTDGFPPLTRTPIAAGGVPPSGLDMNGILYEMSAIIRWANAGGGYPFDGTFAADTNVGGYPKGARIMRSDGQGYWFNTTDNNVTDPNDAGAVAAGWVPDFSTGVTAVTMTGSSVTLTPLQYGKRVIAITGALTANLNLIFPNIADNWVILNGTTGGYTITAKTAAGTGAPLGAVTPIFGDGNSIYAANSDSVQVVGSVAKLRTIAPNASRIMKTSGYYVAGDNGNGNYCARTGAAPGTYVDTGGTVIVPTGGDGSTAWLLFQTEMVSVRQFGAKGDWNLTTSTGSDDSTPFLNAVAWARTNRRTVAVPGVTPGYAYSVDSTLDLTNGGFFGACLLGENPEASKIITGVSGTTPLVLMTGGSGSATNSAVRNLKLIPKVAGQGVALKINGNDFGQIDNIHADNFNYGIHLYNGVGAGTFTELSQIDRIWVNNCNSNIKIEVGAGDESFHGTTITNVFMNVGAGQIGLDIGAGAYVYNSHLQIHFWGGSSATYIKNLGDCEQNQVEFTYEGTGKIDNQGRFHADGWLTGIGVKQDVSTSYPGTGSGFMLDNYFTPRTPTNANLIALGVTSIAAMSKNSATVNGLYPAIVRLTGPNVEAVGIDVYGAGTPTNGLALMGSNFQDDAANATIFHLLGKSAWTTFNDNLPIVVNGQPSTQFQLNSAGLHSGRMGRDVPGAISANAGISQIITVTGANYASGDIGEMLFFRIIGANFEWRGLFTCNHSGYGGAGSITQLATFFTINDTGGGCVYPSGFAINSSGQFTFNVTTDRALTFGVKNIGISSY